MNDARKQYIFLTYDEIFKNYLRIYFSAKDDKEAEKIALNHFAPSNITGEIHNNNNEVIYKWSFTGSVELFPNEYMSKYKKSTNKRRRLNEQT